MRKPLAALLIASIALPGCGAIRDSRLNPFNWFGRAEVTAPAPGSETGAVNPLIPKKRQGVLQRPEEVYQGVLVDRVSELRVERTPGGAVVRVTGISLLQGAYEVQLAAAKTQPKPNELLLELKAVQPLNQRQGSEASRRITAALDLTEQDLQGIRVIRVKAARNSATTRR